jgi:hypothetical protein
MGTHEHTIVVLVGAVLARLHSVRDGVEARDGLAGVEDEAVRVLARVPVGIVEVELLDRAVLEVLGERDAVVRDCARRQRARKYA